MFLFITAFIYMFMRHQLRDSHIYLIIYKTSWWLHDECVLMTLVAPSEKGITPWEGVYLVVVGAVAAEALGTRAWHLRITGQMKYTGPKVKK